jgi:hypothetical protein
MAAGIESPGSNDAGHNVSIGRTAGENKSERNRLK